ncbi:class III extradiol ring-cleavage dioxygenase [uncultured Sphaerochaeta sp.]|uniref:DODA-type extradiol aromatic ring-opening family dioxygenase n=1 Tax=uncultured Sphaerochaeta sp. TaxID=886478 RepID=UPI002A0A2506|nr:class III extradiol ring-cleavage dioxygenase [uncultured Sphaerochaeta sp.]
MSETTPKGQILYFSHGGGPLPLLGDASHKAMIAFLKGLPVSLHKPEAIVVISAHWEEPVATVLSSPNPPMFYDYYGFPAETYTVTYPAPGNPALAHTLETLLQAANIPTASDTLRGFDHGVFIPLMLMYPEADIPTTQLSLVRGLNAKEHLELGKALAPLMEQNVLVIGSGFSFHNMAAFSYDADKKQDSRNEAFQNWLKEVCTGPYTEQERENFLLDWEQAPSARYCHPREEHLLPLLSCVAMGQKEGKVVFDDYILGKRSLAFLWT